MNFEFENIKEGSFVVDSEDDLHKVDAIQYFTDGYGNFRTIFSSRSFVWASDGSFLSGPFNRNLKIKYIATPEDYPEVFL